MPRKQRGFSVAKIPIMCEKGSIIAKISDIYSIKSKNKFYWSSIN